MRQECDNFSDLHSPQVIGEDNNAVRVICTKCKNQYIIHKDWRGIPENREYSRIFKMDIIQGHENLFYKLHPQHLRT